MSAPEQEREPRWLDDAELAAWLPLVQVVIRLPGALDRQLRAEAGLPHAHYQILAALSSAPQQALRMSELAQVSGTSQSRLSHAVAALEGRGWVERRPCPSDKRGQIAGLTDTGQALLDRIAPGHVEAVRRLVFDGLTRDELAQLQHLSERIVARLDTEPAT